MRMIKFNSNQISSQGGKRERNSKASRELAEESQRIDSGQGRQRRREKGGRRKWWWRTVVGFEGGGGSGRQGESSGCEDLSAAGNFLKKDHASS